MNTEQDRSGALEKTGGIPLVAPVCYLAIILYGSFIPFRLRQISLLEAWQRFVDLPYLQLGAASRADWIANILLYVPLALLLAAWLEERSGRSALKRIGTGSLVFVVCLFVAVFVEFTQVFIAPRTVSMNDLIAEMIGAILGLLVWFFGWGQLRNLWGKIRSGGDDALQGMFVAYFACYLLMAFFPYDVLVSWNEWQSKLAGGHWGWLWAGDLGPFKRIVLNGVEIAAAVPFGFWIGLRIRQWRSALKRAVVFGLTLGIGIEVLQIGLASGVTQGMSVVTRAVGVVAGAVFLLFLEQGKLRFLRPWIRPAILFLLLPYLFILVYVNGWFGSDLLGLKEGTGKFSWQMLLPFYFHYFTTETRAVVSVLVFFFLYFPMGLAGFAWDFINRRIAFRARKFVFPAFFLACFLELGKFFLQGKHPDFTNVLLAVLASWIGYKVARWFVGMMQKRFELFPFRAR